MSRRFALVPAGRELRLAQNFFVPEPMKRLLFIDSGPADAE
jgi:hypothetical protein